LAEDYARRRNPAGTRRIPALDFIHGCRKEQADGHLVKAPAQLRREGEHDERAVARGDGHATLGVGDGSGRC
jgi:hypothetical protein